MRTKLFAKISFAGFLLGVTSLKLTPLLIQKFSSNAQIRLQWSIYNVFFSFIAIVFFLLLSIIFTAIFLLQSFRKRKNQQAVSIL